MPIEEWDATAKKLADDISDVPGHLTEREARHLVLLVACSSVNGVILEIGSFMGKSTILLSRAAQLADGDPTVVAVDPLTQPAETDPETPGESPSRESFYTNLKNAGAAANVEFREMLSQELARDWSRPIRLLWIDGDHTWDGVLADFEHFAPNLPLGGLIALHDVMHDFEGPTRVMIERVLASDKFGPAGIVGSIGWAQKISPNQMTPAMRGNKQTLTTGLTRWLKRWKRGGLSGINRHLLKLQRSRVPHGALNAGDLAGLLRLTEVTSPSSLDRFFDSSPYEEDKA